MKSDSDFMPSFSETLDNWEVVGPASGTASGSSKARTSSLSDAKACHTTKGERPEKFEII